ncbi:uncharacterized protein [Leptinotarsa decemlineata]|uniref:uncharacterized protein n=1 Tax=Leptinotarsa decemlineata TaxID=7539 RepID=UPI003D308DE7
MTTLCDCEAIINAKPSTYISDEDNLKPLSPSMFISDISTSETPDFDIIDRHHLVKRHRYLQKIRDGLRNRLRKEYLAELVHTGQRKIGSSKIGDVVLVSSNNVKRINWPIGKVLEIYPGNDGIPRIAKIKVNSGELIRPFQRLHPLEVTTEQDCKNFLQIEKKMIEVNGKTNGD